MVVVATTFNLPAPMPFWVPKSALSREHAVNNNSTLNATAQQDGMNFILYRFAPKKTYQVYGDYSA